MKAIIIVATIVVVTVLTGYGAFSGYKAISTLQHSQAQALDLALSGK